MEPIMLGAFNCTSPLDWIQKFTIGRDGFYSGQEEQEYNQAYNEQRDSMFDEAGKTLLPIGIAIMVILVLLIVIKYLIKSNRKQKVINRKKARLLKTEKYKNIQKAQEQQRMRQVINLQQKQVQRQISEALNTQKINESKTQENIKGIKF